MAAKVTAKAVSQVSEQLPSFIGEDFPLYEKFVKNYFEFLETIIVPYGIVTGYLLYLIYVKPQFYHLLHLGEHK